MEKTTPRLHRASAAVLLLAVWVAGCSSSSDYLGKPKDEPNIVPTDYRKEIVNTLKLTLIDPTNVKDAYITDPTLAAVGNDQRYVVCIRSNSRGYQREYLGNKERIAYFYGGHLNQLVDAKPEQCANAAYKPFPELLNLCHGESCQ